jgi:hypothetical protein
MFRMLEDEYTFPFTGKCSKHVTVLHVRESCTFLKCENMFRPQAVCNGNVHTGSTLSDSYL